MMAEPAAIEVHHGVDATAVLNGLLAPILVLDDATRCVYANPAAEQFFGVGAPYLVGRALSALVAAHSPLFALITQARGHGSDVLEHSVEIGGPRVPGRLVNIQVSALVETPGWVVVSLEDLTLVTRIDRQLSHRGAARSVAGMAAVLAHEVKNPLAGIRGAAQLLEQNASGDDRELARLIRDESDRVCRLLEQIDMFGNRPMARGPVNIHEVLARTRRLAQSSFASHVSFHEHYDPSLPLAYADGDGLIQVFLNLIKNAAEAVAARGGEIELTTAFRPGVRIETATHGGRLSLPLEAGVRDNGSGIPDDIAAHLFDPFVTNKVGGTGLGLAMVAKIVDEHGGVIEFDSTPEGCEFRVRLPVCETAPGKA